MGDQKKQLEESCERIAVEIGNAVKTAVEEAVRDSFKSTLDDVVQEGEFYRNVNKELLSGLKGIYHEISDSQSPDDASETKRLLNDTSNRLEEIMHTTRNATVAIMENVEKLITGQEEAGAIIATLEVDEKYTSSLSRLDSIISGQEALLTEILTACSFEDLTGQRLKKVIEAVSAVRNTVFDLYLSSGLMIKEREDNPDKELAEVVEEGKRKVQEIKNSELKGPTMDTDQSAVDDLLASLGL